MDLVQARPGASQRPRRRGRRGTAIGLVVALAATLLGFIAAAAPALAQEGGTTEPVTYPRELVELRTSNSSTEENADGTRTTKITHRPKHFVGSSGGWEVIDNTLVPDGLGGYRNKANSFSVTFAALPAAVSLSTPEGSLTMTPLGAAPVAPQVDGATVTYPNAWPGVDLKYRVEPEGVKEDIVVRARPLTNRFSFAVTGASLTKTADGGLVLGSGNWSTWRSMPPEVLDSAGTPAPAAAPRFALSTSLLGQQTVAVEVDGGWLGSLPDSAFPITIDPTLHSTGAQQSNSYKSDGVVCGPCPIRVGNPNEPGRWVSWRGVAHFPYENLYGRTLVRAQAFAWNLTGGTANADWIDVYHGGWDWPTLHGGLLANAYAGTSFTFEGNLKGFYQGLLDSHSPGAALKFLIIDENGQYSYKELGAFELHLTWNAPPGTDSYSPGNEAVISDNTPTIQARGTDPNNDNVAMRLHLYTEGGGYLGGKNGGWICNGCSDNYTHGSALPDGRYFWDVWAWDGYADSPITRLYFRITTAAPNRAPNQPTSLQPPDGATGQSTTLALSGIFSDPDGGTGQLIMEIWPDGGNQAFHTGSGSVVGSSSRSTYNVPSGVLQAGTSYRWRAKARDSVGAESAWTGLIRFTTQAANRAPAAPTELSPSDGATTNTTPAFSAVFSDPDNHQGKIEVEVRNDTMTQVVHTGSGSTVASGSRSNYQSPSGVFAAGTAYRWRARSVDQHGAASAYTGYLRFVVHQEQPPTGGGPSQTNERYDTYEPAAPNGRKVFISPAKHSPDNTGCDGHPESYWAKQVGEAAARTMRDRGYLVYVGKLGPSGNISSSNDLQPHLHLPLHSNAGGEDCSAPYNSAAGGTVMLYEAGNPDSERAAMVFLDAIKDGSPGTSDRTCTDDSSCSPDPLGELRQINAVPAYIEVGYHTFKPDADWIRTVNDPATRIADGADRYFGSMAASANSAWAADAISLLESDPVGFAASWLSAARDTGFPNGTGLGGDVDGLVWLATSNPEGFTAYVAGYLRSLTGPIESQLPLPPEAAALVDDAFAAMAEPASWAETLVDAVRRTAVQTLGSTLPPEAAWIDDMASGMSTRPASYADNWAFFLIQQAEGATMPPLPNIA